MTMNDISQLSFEEAFEELESIVEKLESGDLTLENSVKFYERGRLLSDHCQKVLDEAELRVNRLTEGGDIEPLE